MSRSLVSVVIPCFNEEAVLDSTLDRVLLATRNIPRYHFEILVVDDGSRDQTWDIIQAWGQKNTEIRGLRLSRNFGHQAALSCGYDQARGSAIISIDADLQDPPELFDQMLNAWENGNDTVYMARKHRHGETRFKLWTATLFYKLLNKLSAGMDFQPNCGDFRLISRRVCDAMKAMPECNRYLRGMVRFVGYPSTTLEYDRQPRCKGETKYPFRKMLLFALDAICSFSEKPLKLAYFLSLFMALPFVIYIVFTFIRSLTTDLYFQPGWASLLLSVVAFGSANLFMLGVIGEYLGRTYMQVKARPLFVIMEDTTNTGSRMDNKDV